MASLADEVVVGVHASAELKLRRGIIRIVVVLDLLTGGMSGRASMLARGWAEGGRRRLVVLIA